MKITLWVENNGTTYVATPEMTDERKRVRVGHISIDSDETYRVIFRLSFLEQFNRAGFATRSDAVSYEQDIINENLAEHLHELFEKG